MAINTAPTYQRMQLGGQSSFAPMNDPNNWNGDIYTGPYNTAPMPQPDPTAAHLMGGAQLDPSTDWFTQNAPPMSAGTNTGINPSGVAKLNPDGTYSVPPPTTLWQLGSQGVASPSQSMIPTIGFAESRESYFNRLRSIGIDPNTVNMGTEADAQDYLKHIQQPHGNIFGQPPNLGQAANPGGYPANLGQMGSQGAAPSFRSGMSDDEVRQAVTQFYAAKGTAPDPTSIDSWVGYYKQFGDKDPTYFSQRLANADEFTRAGKGVPGTPGYTPGASQGSSGPGSPTDIMNQDPGFQFRMGEGLKALQHSAAARGTLLTGGTQKALERYGQDYASGEFGNVFNRNLSLAQLGANSAANATQAGSSYARGAADTTEGVGNTTAAGQVGSANSWNDALGGIANTAEREAYLKWLNGQTPAATNKPLDMGGYGA